jgi:hypothetical protein
MTLNTITEVTRVEKIQAVRDLPVQLEAAIAGMTGSQLDTPYRTGGWSPRQIVHHIADSHMNAFIRMKLVLEEDHPHFKPYDQDAWAKGSDYRLPIDASIGIVRGVHERMVCLLEHVSDLDWSRAGYHPEHEKDLTLDDLLETYYWHGAHHVDQITGLRTKQGW